MIFLFRLVSMLDFHSIHSIHYGSISLISVQLSLSVPTDPSAYIAAFTVVIVVSLIKQGYEDWVRHKADDNINQTLVHVIQSNGSIKVSK